MVKGLTRRVIVIKSPEKSYFDEVIFILSEDKNVSQKDIVREAEEVVRESLSSESRKRLPPFIFSIIGGGIIGAIWLAYSLFL